MTRSWPQRALLALGLLLVTVPLYAPALDVTGTEYRYEATEITVENDRLDIADEGLVYGGGIDGIDCFVEGWTSRTCVYEATALDGNVTADHPDVRRVSGSPGPLTGDRYVAYTDGRVFLRTTDWTDGRYVLGLQRTNASAALDWVATDERYAPPQAVRTVRDGPVRVDDALWDDAPREGHVVAVDGAYYVVVQTDRDGLLSAKPLLERILEAASVALGLAVLSRVWSA